MLKTSVSRWSRLEANVFEVLLALLAISAVITYAFLPQSFGTAATRLAFGDWAYLWLGGYGIAGLAIIVGIWLFRHDIEALGLTLLATAVAINGVAILAAFGLRYFVTLGVHIATVGACAVNIKLILRGEVVALLSSDKDVDSEEEHVVTALEGEAE